MTVLQALILGVVQGFTEFLPVSSSGHLVIVPQIFNFSQPPVGFDVLVHLATLVAVVGYFIGDIAQIVRSVLAPRTMSHQDVNYWRRILAWLIVGSIPAAIAGFLFGDFFESLFSQTLGVGICLVMTSLLLWGSDAALGRINKRPLDLQKMRGLDALIVGCFQALAIAPGLSRSGATIAGGVFLGFDRAAAARISFLLSIPAILGAFLFQLKDASGAFAGASEGAYLAGALAAAVSGFIAIFLLMRYLKRHRLRVFAVYTLIAGVIVVILSLM